MPIIKARSSSIIPSVDLRGTPTAPTASSGTHTTQVATTDFVSTAVTNLVNGAPSILDTLSELASAINNDQSFSVTLTNLIGTKVALAGDTMTGTLVLSGDPVNNLDAVTKQYVDNNINAVTIHSTDDVPEGSVNLYYLDDRARNSIMLSSDNTSVLDYNSTTGVFTYTHPNSDGILEGSTNKYYTDARVRNAISLNSDDHQILSYGSSSGQFTFTTPSTDKITEGTINKYFTTARARASISAGNNINYDSATGIISSLAAVDSVNGQTGIVVLDTDNIDEGSANLYFTQSRARGSVNLTTDNTDILSYNSTTGTLTWTTPSTDAISEGTNNLYFTNARVRDALSASGDISYNSSTGNFSYSTPTTDGVNEGSSNLYFTSARARNSISLTTSNSDIISYDSTTGQFTFALSQMTTDEVAEGTNHLYFTNARARSAVSVSSNWSNISYNSSTGVVSVSAPSTSDVTEGSNLYYTNARARASLSVTNASGDGSVSYDNTTGTFTYTGPSNSEVRAHFSAIDNGGDGSFSYDNTTGAFTYTGPSDSEVRAHFTADGASGVTYDNTTGNFALSSIPNGSLANSSITILGAPVSLGGSITFDTGDVSEGSNLYFTTSRARNSISVNDTSGALSYDSTTGVLTFNISAGVSSVNGMTGAVVLTTDDINEGINNLYYTTTRTRADVSGGTGVTYTQSTGVFEIGQDVSTTSNVTFNDVTVSGNLTVQGTMTAIQSTTVEITDKNLTLAKGSANGAQADGAGLTVDGVNATFEYKSGTDSWEFNKGIIVHGDAHVNDVFYGNDVRASGGFTGNLTGNVTGQVSDLSNHTTSDVTEGSNLYYTNSRARNAVSLTSSNTNVLSYDASTGTFTFALNNQTTDDVAEGSSNLYFTSARARNALSATKTGGDGNFSYDASSGTFTYTGPTSTDYRNAISISNIGGYGALGYNSSTGVISFSGTTDSDIRSAISVSTATGAQYDSSTGVISLSSIPNSSLTYDTITINGTTVALGDSNSFGTDSVSEENNLYFTTARARNSISLTTSNSDILSYDSTTGEFTFALSNQNTDEVSEGATNLYFTTARARASISASGDLSYDSTTGVISYTHGNTDTVNEGVTNLYFTNSRARQAISLTTDNTDALSYDNTTGNFHFTLSSVDTDEIVEGSTNLYFTTSRARNTISGGTNISYDSATGIISTEAAVHSVNGQQGTVVLDTDNINEGSMNLYFTDSRAQGAISLTSDNTDILSYNSANGAFSFTTPTTDAISEGQTNLYYTDTRVTNLLNITSINALSDVDLTSGLSDGYTLVWSSVAQNFVPQNIATASTNLNFTGDGTTSSFNTGVEVSSIDNTQVYVNGLIQAPTYSYTLSTVSNVTSIVFDTAPEANDYIMIKVISTASLTAGGVLNEASNIDGGTF